MQKILNGYRKAGTDISEFRKLVAEMTAATEIKVVSGEELTYYTNTTDGAEPGILSCPSDILTGLGRFISIGGTNGLKETIFKGWCQELIEESTGSFAFFVSTNNLGLIPVSSSVAGDFSLYGITGSAAANPTYPLLCLVAQQTANRKITLCLRTAEDTNGDKIRKLFSLRSGRYMYIPQNEALSIAETLCEGGEFVNYYIDNFVTSANWSFNDNKTNATYGLRKKSVCWTPYIHFTTSDAGESSCTFELGWNTGSATVFLASGANSVSRKHVGEWNKVKQGFIKSALSLRDKLTVLPEQMKKQDEIVVSAADVKDVVMNLCKDAKVSAIGKGIAQAIADAVSLELSTEAEYTAAEIIISMMEQQDKLQILKNLSDSQMTALKRALAETPYQRIRRKI